MDQKKILSVKNLKKIYSSKEAKDVNALNDLNLDVKEGEIFGLLGPNGAGKTTFINILAGTVIKSAGKVNVWGFDLDVNPRQVRSSIGIVPQEINLDPFFSPKSILELQAGLFGVPKKDQITDEILKLVSLEKQANAYSRGLSGGMKRRLLIAKALVHQPPILILDEPSAGIDVQLRKELWLNIKSLHKSGVTIILTTHNLYEAQEMCDRIAILKKGKLIALDTTNNLLQKLKTKKIMFIVENIDSFSNKKLNNVIFSINKNEITATYQRNQNNIEEIINFLKVEKLKILDISTDNGDLEDVFIQLTKN